MIERRPVPVFKDPARATSPPLDDAALAAAEAALGLTLPREYVALLRREANGGKLRRSLFPCAHPALAGAAHLPYLLGVGGPRGLPGLQVLAAHWRYPVERPVLLDSQGPRALLLDYADPAAPGVVYVDMKHADGPLRVDLAPSFAALLEGLQDGSPSFDLVLAPELGLEPARQRLTERGWSYEGNHYGIHILRRAGLELRLLSNHQRDGDGFLCCEYPECPLVAQLRGPRPDAEPAAAEVQDAWGESALLVCSPHAAALPLD
ncbi:MAG: SMI1/KNR4 family protein [Planctomycetota bacterium]